jgi:hypothetical protein
LEIWDFTGLEILICFYDQETTPIELESLENEGGKEVHSSKHGNERGE